MYQICVGRGTAKMVVFPVPTSGVTARIVTCSGSVSSKILPCRSCDEACLLVRRWVFWTLDLEAVLFLVSSRSFDLIVWMSGASLRYD